MGLCTQTHKINEEQEKASVKEKEKQSEKEVGLNFALPCISVEYLSYLAFILTSFMCVIKLTFPRRPSN